MQGTMCFLLCLIYQLSLLAIKIIEVGVYLVIAHTQGLNDVKSGRYVYLLSHTILEVVIEFLF